MTSHLPGYSGYREAYEQNYIPKQQNHVPLHKYGGYEKKRASLSDDFHFRSSSQMDLSRKNTYVAENYPGGEQPVSEYGLAHRPWGTSQKPIMMSNDANGQNVVYNNRAGRDFNLLATQRAMEHTSKEEGMNNNSLISTGLYTSTTSGTLYNSMKSRLTDIHQVDFLEAQRVAREKRAAEVQHVDHVKSNGLSHNTMANEAKIKRYNINGSKANTTSRTGTRFGSMTSTRHRLDQMDQDSTIPISYNGAKGVAPRDQQHPGIALALHHEHQTPADDGLESVWKHPLLPAEELSPTTDMALLTGRGLPGRLPPAPTEKVPPSNYLPPSSTVDLQQGTSRAYLRCVPEFGGHLPAAEYNVLKCKAREPTTISPNTQLPPLVDTLLATSGKRGIEGYTGYTPKDPYNVYRMNYGQDYNHQTQQTK